MDAPTEPTEPRMDEGVEKMSVPIMLPILRNSDRTGGRIHVFNIKYAEMF